MGENIAISKFTSGDNKKEFSLEEDVNKQLEKVKKGLCKGVLCTFAFDELRGLK